MRFNTRFFLGIVAGMALARLILHPFPLPLSEYLILGLILFTTTFLSLSDNERITRRIDTGAKQ